MSKPTLLDLPDPSVRVMIAIPSGGHPTILFAMDLAKLVRFVTYTMVAEGSADIMFGMVDGTYVHRAREELVEMALDDDATHILWLDDDMRFPRHALHHLLKRDKDIVGVNYPTRKFPTIPVAIKQIFGKDQRLAFTYEDSSGLEEVEAAGFGVMLTRTDVFKKLPRPWFNNTWVDDEVAFMGEDVWFCSQARRHDYKVYIDHDLSHEIRHGGYFEFRNEHAEQVAEMDGLDKESRTITVA